MNYRQQRFVDLYIETGDMGLSYEKAGYVCKSRRNRDASASHLFSRVKQDVNKRIEEINKASSIRIETKRMLLWEIAEKASGRIKPNLTDDEVFQPDYKAAIAAINELNRMDGHHQDSKFRIKSNGFVFDAEIEAEDPDINSKLIQ